MDGVFSAKILLVNDHNLITEVVKKQLVRRGFINVDCDSGQNAKKLLKKKKYDLLVQDCQRPSPNGTELYCWMKKNKDLANVPIIFLTLSKMICQDERGFAIVNGRKFELVYEIFIDTVSPYDWRNPHDKSEGFFVEGFIPIDSPSVEDEVFEILSRIFKFNKHCPDLGEEHKRRNKYLWPDLHLRY